MTTNRLLATLLDAAPALRVACDTLAGPAGTVLARPGTPAAHLYFPTTGVLSVVVDASLGRRVETFTVGREGMLGCDAWLGVPHVLETIALHAPGTVVRVPAAAVRRRAARAPRVARLLDGFAAFRLRLGWQVAACSLRHSVEQRTCRWLLCAADRGGPQIHATQARLARLLGVRRQSVGAAVLRLERAGIIDWRPRGVCVLDRRGLERHACGCYRTIAGLYRSVVTPLL